MHDKKDFTITLMGNPNVGKSTVFNALTGMHQHTGNWAGKTVESARGEYTYNNNKYTIFDLPGTYSIRTMSKEEEVARDFLKNRQTDVTVVVCDATCLERNLNLVLQTLEITKNTILCVNLIDEARKKKIKIDKNALSDELGIEVVICSARKKEGLLKLKEAIEKEVNAERKLPNIERTPEETVKMSKEIFEKAVIMPKRPDKSDRRLDRILTNKITGIPVMLLLLALILWITVEGANYPSDFLYSKFFLFEKVLVNFFINLGVPAYIYNPLVFGIYRVSAWVVAVMLPPMAIFFPLFTLLEDFGYLPRVAFNLDSFFKKAHSCGKQSLCMCMGLGCNAVGVEGSRIIDSPRERLLSILTNNFMPCNGRLPTLILVATIFFASSFLGSMVSSFVLLASIVLGVAVTLLASFVLSKTILKGEKSSFVLELPPYRRPQILKVIVRSVFERTVFVLMRAISVSAPMGLLIYLVTNVQIRGISILGYITMCLEPIGRIMGLDGVILTAFILAFPANEIAIPLMLMAYSQTSIIEKITDADSIKMILLSNGWSVKTGICVMLFCIMHWPCSTTLLTIKKETRSLKWTLLAFVIPTIFGFCACVVCNLIFNIVGKTA